MRPVVAENYMSTPRTMPSAEHSPGVELAIVPHSEWRTLYRKRMKASHPELPYRYTPL